MKKLYPLLFLALFACKKEKMEAPAVVTPTAVVTPANTNPSTNPPAAVTKIKVTIQNIKSQDGLMRIALFNSETSFNASQNWVKADSYALSGNILTIEWTGLAAGDYAISVYHDKNGNNKLDKNLFGIPQEGFAFSNNAMGIASAPSYSQAKFKLDANTTATQIIDLIYY